MLLNKAKKLQMDSFLQELLGLQDVEVIAVRGKECRTIFLNDAAKNRLQLEELDGTTCRQGYFNLFPGLCERCPNQDTQIPSEPSTFDVSDTNGHVYSVTTNTVMWIDDKPATLMFIRDVDEDRSYKARLYELAYLDHLTGVPNRQKLREDFENLAEDIAKGDVVGILALIDMDNFKDINDSYGHNTGDVMLRRLTEHLGSDPVFKDHIYRLGGDEFVLLYSDRMDKFQSEEEMQAYYADMLQGAFLSYTMPNIEKSSTISMGVAMFPKHGDSFSVILRKGDIALYKAKGGGRNQMVFFEDQYDTAKKFKDLYINIQPILMKSGKTFGYELIDKGEGGNESANTLNLTEFNRTLDALGLGEIESDARYMISFSRQLLSPSVLNNLPKDKFVIQVVPSEPPTDGEIALYKQLRAFGYSLCACRIRRKNAVPALLDLVDYCKFTPGALDDYDQKELIADHPKKIFIATNVDGNVQYEASQRKGFKLFQGLFFNEPVVVQKTKDIDPLKVNYYRLLQMTSTDDYVDFQEISSIIAADVALSYKLLKLLNSAAVGLRSKISSITMAVAYLGEENLKKWIGLLALRGLASDKPLELVRMSLIRARFGELLAPHLKPRKDPKRVFLVGMLSLLHIALEKSKEELLDEIPVEDDLRNSLLTKTGVYSDLLSFLSNYEYSNWDEITEFASQNTLSSQFINDCYLAAVKWTNELINA